MPKIVNVQLSRDSKATTSLDISDDLKFSWNNATNKDTVSRRTTPQTSTADAAIIAIARQNSSASGTVLDQLLRDIGMSDRKAGFSAEEANLLENLSLDDNWNGGGQYKAFSAADIQNYRDFKKAGGNNSWSRQNTADYNTFSQLDGHAPLSDLELQLYKDYLLTKKKQPSTTASSFLKARANNGIQYKGDDMKTLASSGVVKTSTENGQDKTLINTEKLGQYAYGKNRYNDQGKFIGKK